MNLKELCFNSFVLDPIILLDVFIKSLSISTVKQSVNLSDSIRIYQWSMGNMRVILDDDVACLQSKRMPYVIISKWIDSYEWKIVDI